MSDEAAFLRSVAAEPNDDGPRLVYADWLEDRAVPCGECGGRGGWKFAGGADVVCGICRGTGALGQPDELRKMLADPGHCYPVVCEPEWERTLDMQDREGLVVVGLRRGLPEYVRLPLDLFVRMAATLADWPILVVDFLGVEPGRQAPGSYVQRFVGRGNTQQTDWNKAKPNELPLELLYGWRPGHRVADGCATFSAFYNWPWHLSRAAVKVLRSAAGFRQLDPTEYEWAERLWAGRTFVPDPPSLVWFDGTGWLPYDSDFRPNTRWSFRAFGGSWQAFQDFNAPDQADYHQLDRSAAWARLPEPLRQADRRSKGELQRYAAHHPRNPRGRRHDNYENDPDDGSTRGRALPITREDLFGDGLDVDQLAADLERLRL